MTVSISTVLVLHRYLSGYIPGSVPRQFGKEGLLAFEVAGCCAPLPQLEDDEQGNEVRDSGQWQSAWDTHGELKGPAGIPSAIRNAEGCNIAKTIACHGF